MYTFRAIPQSKPSLLINSVAEENKNSLVTINLSGSSTTIANTSTICLPIPLFLKKWNITGTIRISRSLENHPSSSLTFYACKKDECDIRLALANGTKVNLFGLAFRIVNFNSSPVSPESEQIEIQLDLTGIHNSFGEPSRNPLDLPIKLKGEKCDRQGWQSLASYAKEVGVQYVGKPIYIYVPKSTSALATITIRQLLNRAIVNQQFIYYSHPERIEARDWGKTTRHNLKGYYAIQSQVFSGSGYLMPQYKVQLAKEYRNTEISLQTIEELSEDDKTKVTKRWEFENARSLIDCQTPAEPLSVGDNIYILKNPTTDILRDPTIAFDTGGFTKTAHEITEENGLETSRKTKTWGWITNSVDTYSVIDKEATIAADQNYSRSVALAQYNRVIFTPYKTYSFISSFWQQVSETITTRKYDKDGYLVEETTTGKKLFRLKQDTSSLEGIGTQLQANELISQAEAPESSLSEAEKIKLKKRGEALLKLAQAYRFTETEPIKKTTTYQLHPFSRYFSDITKPWDDCDWIEPKFAHHTLTTQAKRIVVENPGTTEDFPLLPIITGKEFKEEIKVTITSRKKPNRFVTTRFLLNAEGEGLDQKLKLIGNTEAIGRPSIHQRKEIIEPVPKPPVSKGAFLSQKKPREENKQYKYLLNSPGSNQRGNISTDSISFPDVYDVDLAIKIAQTKLSIDNTKEAEILTIKTLYQPHYKEGDCALFEGKEYVILKIDYTIEIVAPNTLKCDDYQLTLGRLIYPQVTLTKIKNNPKSSLVTGVISGLNAVDGNVTQLKSIYNYLSPGAIANAVALGVLDAFVESTGLRVVGQEEFTEIDGMESFLSGGFSGGGGDLGGGLGGLSFAGLEGGGEKTDLRTKTPIENFADLINRAGLLSQFNDKLDTLLGNKLMEEGNALASSFSPSGGGGGGELGLSGGSVFTGLAPNIILEGGDGFLSGLLNGLFGILDKMLQLLAKEKPSGGAGAGGSGGVGGGGGGGGGAGGGTKPVILIGDLTIYLPTPNFDGLIAMILDMIAEAIALAKSFDLSLEEVLARLLAAAAENAAKAGGGGAGGGGFGGSGGSGRGALGSPNIEYIYPEGLEPATIRIIAPEEDLTVADLSEVFSALDELLFVLDELAEREFDFELDLDLLAEQAGIAQVKTPDAGTKKPATTAGAAGAGGTGGTGGAGGAGLPAATGVQQVIVEVRDISGVIGGGVSPLPKRSTGGGFSSGAGGFSGLSGGGGLSSGAGGLSGGAGAATGGGLAAGGSSGSVGSGSGLSSGGSLSSSGGQSGTQSNYTGNTGEFNFDGWASDGDGYGEDAVAFPGADFTIELVTPVPPGFYFPSSTQDEFLTDTTGEFVTAPANITHIPLYEGDILFIPGAIASSGVQWEILDNIPGVEILTPFDLEPTIEFNNNYAGDFLRLKVFLRGAPEIFDTLTVDTVPTSRANLYGYVNIGQLSDFDQSKVDPTTLIPIPQFANDGAAVPTSIFFRWNHPPFHSTWAASSYTVQEKQPDFSWTDVGTTIAPEFTFEVGKTYRILTNYDNQLQSVASDEFGIDNPPVLGQSSISDLSISTNSEAVTLASNLPTLFYTFFSDKILDDALINEGNKYTTATESISVSSNPPTLFYTFSSSETIDDSFSNEGNYYTIASSAIAPVSTSPSIFYTV